MKFVNLTTRHINIVDENGTPRMVLKPSGIVVGVSTITKVLEYVAGDNGDKIEVVTYEYKSVTALPEAEAGTYFVVSYAVLQALNGKRSDVVAPDTAQGSVMREPGSQKILGVMRFRKL